MSTANDRIDFPWSSSLNGGIKKIKKICCMYSSVQFSERCSTKAHDDIDNKLGFKHVITIGSPYGSLYGCIGLLASHY